MNHKEKEQKITDIKNALGKKIEELRPHLNTVAYLRDAIALLELDLSIARDAVVERVKELR
jgi:hypothetical protein